MSMYILDEAIVLRSWQLVPCAYYIYGIREAKGLTKEQFELLSRCNGRQELADKPLLRELEATGLCRCCEAGESLTDWQKPRTCDNRCFPHINGKIVNNVSVGLSSSLSETDFRQVTLGEDQEFPV